MRHRLFLILLFGLVSLPTSAALIELKINAELFAELNDAAIFEPAVGDTIVGSIVYETDTPFNGPPPSALLQTYSREVIVSGSFSFINSSGDTYLSANLNAEPQSNRGRTLFLENSIGAGFDVLTLAWSDFQGDTVGIDRFVGDPLTYHPNDFRLEIKESVADLLVDGFIDDARVLPTNFSLDETNPDFGGLINFDWLQDGGSRYAVAGRLTSATASLLVPVPEPSTLGLLAAGLLGLRYMRRGRAA